MADKGWIKLNRKIQDHWVWSDHEFAFAWIDLLLMVNHEDKRILVDKKPVIIKRGQTLTSIKKLAARWRWGRDRVYRFLRALECDNMLTRVSTPNGTTLSIVNYSKFQNRSNTDNTTDDTTDKTTDKTTHKTTGKTQTRSIKNVKNDKEKAAPLPSEDQVEQQDDPEDDGPWYTGDELLEMARKGLI